MIIFENYARYSKRLPQEKKRKISIKYLKKKLFEILNYGSHQNKLIHDLIFQTTMLPLIPILGMQVKIIKSYIGS